MIEESLYQHGSVSGLKTSGLFSVQDSALIKPSFFNSNRMTYTFELYDADNFKSQPQV